MAYYSPINDLPDAIVSTIIGLISDTRTRNSTALVCRKFRNLERATRASLTLRGNARDLHLIPTCFPAVTDLDLSLLSPWGHALLSPSASTTDPALLAHRLRLAFPDVTALTLYSRSSSTVQILANLWPRLRRVKLVRWHERPECPLGADLNPLLEQCQNNLTELDLSEFYYWTDDLPPALEAHPTVAHSLTKLNLLTASFTEGFHASEISSITASCPKLQHLLLACMFDPRYLGFLGEEALLSISSNCPELRVLHLIDTSSLSKARRGDPNHDGFTAEDARIGRPALVDFFSGLPLLEELFLDVCNNVRDSGLALEVLASKCPRLTSLMLGQFHGLCSAGGSELDGIALCQGLHSLSIKNSADLTDMGLIKIARGSCKLVKLEVHGCKGITVNGMRTVACLLRKTLVHVSISCCLNLDAAASLCALEPIRDRIQRLHIDCVWPQQESLRNNFDLNLVTTDFHVGENGAGDESDNRISKRSRFGPGGDCSYMPSNGYAANGNGNQFMYDKGWENDKGWEKLQYLSLWIGVGDLLTPLPEVGLGDCPSLEEIQIRVQGDCRGRHKPSQRQFGLSCLAGYPRLSKMKLDCGDTMGYALTAPPGQMDLTLWERFFLSGIGDLSLSEMDYWPPQDPDVNQRSLSLPAAGLLAECIALRKLFIHGTAHEHFMMMLVRNPDINLNLRDVQLREDYYPAPPENEMSTEMRVDSCCRFEDALNRRQIYD